MKNSSLFTILAFLLLIGSITACDSATQRKQQQQTPKPDLNRQQTQAEKDKWAIETYLSSNQIMAKKTASGLHYIINKKGTGQTVRISDRVKINLQGSLLDGTKIEPSGEKIIALNSPIIKGWEEGIQLLKVGGKGTFYIPSSLAYGPRQIGENIPAYSNLIYEIELIEIIK